MSTTGLFNTQDVRLWNQPTQQTSKEIPFAKPFVAPPGLPIGLNSLDIDHNANIRAKAYASDVTKNSFVVHIDCWADTTLYSGGATWLDVAPGNLEYQWGQFATTEDHPWDKPQTLTSRRINFTRPFVTPPKVISFLNQLDLQNDRNYRVKTTVSNIDATGFTLHIDTWGDTVLYSATAGWIAYPEDREYVFSTTANTQDVRPWDKPQFDNQKKINFAGLTFWKNPNVFIALNSLDLGSNANLRVRAYADGVSTTDLTWHIDSWGDSVLYSAGVSILCVV